MNTSENSHPNPNKDTLPPYWLRRVALLSIPMVAVTLMTFVVIVDGIEWQTAHALEMGVTLEPLSFLSSIVFSSLAKILSQIWYIWFLGLVLFYGGWIVKRFERIILFNAVFAMLLPLLIIVPSVIYLRRGHELLKLIGMNE